MGAFMTRSLVAILVSCSVCLCAFLAGPGGSLAQTAERPLSFNRDIRPILSDKCLACHGQDAKKREADLRLDTFEGATADLGGTRAIAPGDLEKSELWVRVNSSDEDEVMPPPASHKSLSDAEKALLKQWIAQGAPYQKHWAFEPIQRPAVPQIAGVTQPIDAFLLERLQQVGLTPQPLADRETLIRRVALALTGLPPTIAEIDAYLADETPEAYERMVDRYLASPRYGEEMARHWLDVAQVCRYPRIAPRQRAADVGLPRLGRQSVQRQSALRPVQPVAGGGRSAAQSDDRAADRHGIQSLQCHDQ